MEKEIGQITLNECIEICKKNYANTIMGLCLGCPIFHLCGTQFDRALASRTSYDKEKFLIFIKNYYIINIQNEQKVCR